MGLGRSMCLCTIIVFLVLTFSSVSAKETYIFQDRIYDLYRTKNFSALSAISNEASISPFEKSLLQAIFFNAYNKPSQSNQLINKLKLASEKTKLNFIALRTKYDNHIKLHEYKSAFQTINALINDYGSYFNDDELDSEKENRTIFKILSNVSKQVVVTKKKTFLTLKKDKLGLDNIPIQINRENVNFVMDTGAGLSVVTETCAKQLNLKYVSQEICQCKAGVTGLTISAKIAVAEKLVLGEIVFKHIVFLVFPDKILNFRFEQGEYQINGIIGFPVIKDLGTLVFQGENLEIPTEYDNKNIDKPNMIIDGLKPVIFMNVFNTTIPFTFDTGATSSVFSNIFYDKFKNQIEENGNAVERKMVGAAGEKSLKGLLLPELTMAVYDKKVTLNKVFISKEAIETNGNFYYGNVGQDIIRQFKKMIISFDKSFIYFE